MVLVEIVLSIIIVLVGYNWYQNYKLKWIPTVPGLPILGNVFFFRDTKEIINNFVREIDRRGKLIKGSLLTEMFIVTTDYDFVEFILGSRHFSHKSRVYDYLKNWLGEGLLTGSGPRWKKIKKMATPTFHVAMLKEYIKWFEASEKILVELLEKEVGKESVDIYPYISLFALDVICGTAMGASINAQMNKNPDYVNNVKEASRIVICRVINLLKGNDLLYKLSRDYYKELKVIKELHAVSYAVIDARKKEIKNEARFKLDQDIKKKITFLDILLQSTIDGQPLQEKEIREEVDTFMLGGFDTVASTMSFVLFMLANHPEVQGLAFQEQKEIFGDDTRTPTYNDLQEMKYMELVIKETLRLYPAVPLLARKATEDIEYKGNIIPIGTNIFIFVYGVHRDPDNYSDPEKFNPSRIEYTDATRPYSFIPFSAGPRSCVGQKFAMLEMRSTLSVILRNFELLPSIPEHKLILNPEIVLKSHNGMRIRLTKRKW